jgi:MazG family protein
MSESAGLAGLVAIMDRLRDPGGCPWDREQSYASLRRYLLEECHEVVEALDRSDLDALREELGDLLFQIVFLSRLGKEDGAFTIDDVVRGIADKLVRRHPHVFGSESAATPEEVERNWERIKREEKPTKEPRRSVLEGIPSALPALLRAQRLGERAATVGFDWERPEQVLDQVASELAELRSAVARGDGKGTQEEIGDLLFSVVMAARRLRVEADAALQRTNRKFMTRFAWMEEELARRGESVESADLERLEELWQRAKNELA